MDSLQRFQSRLNAQPTIESVESTPDKKALTVVISHIEMTLDELYFGQWRTENFKWSHIANEVQGSIELVVTHPVTGHEIRRTGAASIVIMVDKVPEDLMNNQQERNKWALNVQNKKPNALDLAFPKLKAECLKNAAISLGKVFGRDLNRKNKDDPTLKTFAIGYNLFDFENFDFPNVITPNGDGLNDSLDINGYYKTCQEYNLLVYNRWGQVVYEQTISSPSFAGRSNNDVDLVDGIYFYTLTYGENQKNGFIHVIR
jgi:gliding motility-associated-like protein